jgi:hypothetical protein
MWKEFEKRADVAHQPIATRLPQEPKLFFPQVIDNA